MEMTVLISIGFTILGGLIGYFGFKRNQNNDLKQETREDTKSKVELNAKLDVLLSNNAEIKGSFRELDKKLDTFKDDVNVRLTRVEENCKQYERRIENLEVKEK